PHPSFADRTPPPETPDNYRVVGRQYKTRPPAPAFAEPPPQSAAGPNAPFRQSPPETAGGAIDVQPGETLYSIGRRYGVSPAAIKDANGLSSDTVRPGQRLVMPSGTQDNRASFGKAPPLSEDRTVVARATPPASPPQAPPSLNAPAGDAPPGWEGRYTMRNGDSLHGIALGHRVTVDELKRANGITDPTKIWAGAVLNVPAQPDAAAAPPPAPNGAPRAP